MYNNEGRLGVKGHKESKQKGVMKLITRFVQTRARPWL